MNQKRIFRQPRPATADEIDALVQANAIERLSEALIGLTLASSAIDDAYGVVTRSDIVNHHHPGVRGAAVLCLGHLARLHRHIPAEPTVTIVERALKDPDEWVRGQAITAASDLRQFVPDVAKRFSTAC